MEVVSHVPSVLGVVQRWATEWRQKKTGPAITVIVDGCKLKTRDWSLSGFRLMNLARPLKPRERLSGTIRACGGRGSFVAEVMWVDPAGKVGFRFIEIAPKVFLAMSGLGA